MPDQSGVAIGATSGADTQVNPRIAALTGGVAIADGPISAARLGSSDMDGPAFQTFDIGPAVEAEVAAEGDITAETKVVVDAEAGGGGEVAPDGGIPPPGDEADLEAASAVGEEAVVEAPQGGEADSATYTADGTLLKPVIVDDDANGIEDQVKVYKVKAGDTLVGIAAKFDLDMYTLWWANRLKAKDELHIGQKLYIPPTDGVLYTAQEGDTVETIAAKFRANVEEVIAFNDLEGDTVVIGQQLMVPDGRGAAIPTPKPTPKPKPRVTSTGAVTAAAAVVVAAAAPAGAATSVARCAGPSRAARSTSTTTTATTASISAPTMGRPWSRRLAAK
jgi:LysM repeat protein